MPLNRWMNLAGNVWAGLFVALFILQFVVFGVSFRRGKLADKLGEICVTLICLWFVPVLIFYSIKDLPLIILVTSIFIAGVFLLLGFAWIRGAIQRRRKPNGR